MYTRQVSQFYLSTGKTFKFYQQQKPLPFSAPFYYIAMLATIGISTQHIGYGVYKTSKVHRRPIHSIIIDINGFSAQNRRLPQIFESYINQLLVLQSYNDSLVCGIGQWPIEYYILLQHYECCCCYGCC